MTPEQARKILAGGVPPESTFYRMAKDCLAAEARQAAARRPLPTDPPTTPGP